FFFQAEDGIRARNVTGVHTCALRSRNGAGAVYLSVFHPDVVSFLSAKKENADEKIRVKTLSLGLVVPDKFYELAEKDEMMYLFRSEERRVGKECAAR